jgi:hypothetical protein
VLVEQLEEIALARQQLAEPHDLILLISCAAWEGPSGWVPPAAEAV